MLSSSSKSNQKVFQFFNKETLSFKSKFYLLMDLLVSNQLSSSNETFIFIGIFYIQLLSGFFSKDINVLRIDGSQFDILFNYIEQFSRMQSLFINHYQIYKIFFYVITALLLIITIFFLIQCSQINRKTLYSFRLAILNYSVKLFVYVLYNIILDFSISAFCFQTNINHPHFPKEQCSYSNNISHIVIACFMLIYSTIINIFIQFFYIDSLYLSNSPYAKISCNYELLMSVNSIIYSILLRQAKYLSSTLFLLYNIASSLFFFVFYVQRCIFYSYRTNVFGGIFHILYLWTSIFFMFFSFFDYDEVSIVYFFTSIVVVFLYTNLKNRLEDTIMFTTPYYKILNPYHLLYYLKNIINMINQTGKDPTVKSSLAGVLKMHALECPNKTCLSKTKAKIYLPITDEWSDRSEEVINDKVYLLNFVIVIMNYFIGRNYYSAEMIINLSLYYLEIIGNYCKAMYFYQKVKTMKLSFQEYFSFVRLEIAISKRLVSKFKQANDVCMKLEDLDVTYYFKSADLSQKLYEEMTNDVKYSLEFWKCFKMNQIDANRIIDFNHIFYLTDNIRVTKEKVENIWRKLFNIFNGVNDLFDLYLNYTEHINDDDLLKRDLEEIKRKSETSADFIQQNYYNILFSQDTCIIIANGDVNKEGIIEKANNEIENIFKYKPEEVKGLNISKLMPNLIAKEHDQFIRNYFEIGEKKLLDKTDKKVFALDKDNSILLVRIALKLFPVLNDSVFFVSLITKENVDDIIFIDSSFNIQGMSSKLMKILQIGNKSLFHENQIPFYLICKKFVNFYKIFLSKSKQSKNKNLKTSDDIILSDCMNSATTPFYGNYSARRETTFENSGQFRQRMSIAQGAIKIKEQDDNCSSAYSSKDNDDKDHYDNNATGLIGSNNNLGNSSKRRNNKGQNDKTNSNEETDNIEINENIELEYEIRIPQYIYEYALYQNKKDKRLELKASNLNALNDNNNIEDKEITANQVIAETNEEFGESDVLINEQPIKPQKVSNMKDFVSPRREKTATNNNVNINVKLVSIDEYNTVNTGANYATPFTTPNPNKNFLGVRTDKRPNTYITPGNGSGHSITPYLQTGGGNNFPKNGISSSYNVLMALNKQTDEEKTFEMTLKKGKLLFDNGMFNELEDFIETSNKDSPMKDFKFNFTFDRIKYGNGQIAYVVRCIDNKNETGCRSDGESVGEENDFQICRFRKEKNEALRFKYEIYEMEKNEIIDQYQNFIALSLENADFQKMLHLNKEKIRKTSIIHGHKKEEIVEDENSSQTSQGSFNNDLCKKNHIEEIRSNLMKNVSNFYTLKYIKLVISLLFISTIIFIVLFCYDLTNIHTDLKMSSLMNVNLHQTTFWLSSLISTIISLRTLYLHHSMQTSYEFALYIQPQSRYFEKMRELSYTLYSETINYFGEMEANMNKYIDNSDYTFWGTQNVHYVYPGINNHESFPLIVNQLLTNVNSLLKHETFQVNEDINGVMDVTEKQYLYYLSYFVVENYYDNLLPHQIETLGEIPNQLQKKNRDRRKPIIIIIITYFVVSFVLNSIYGVLLYLTNKNMGEGLEKVTKIKLEKIEDTIKKIETFNELLTKYKDKEAIISYNKETMKEFTKTNEITVAPETCQIHLKSPSEQRKITHANSSSSLFGGFSSEGKHHKKLKMLTYSYYQLPVLVIIQACLLIPLYLITNVIIQNTNKLIDVENYMFGKLLISSIQTIEVKCMMSECTNSKTLNYSSLIRTSQISYMIQSMSIFESLYTFYVGKFMYNLCDAAYDSNSQYELYNTCMTNNTILSANNTDSLLKKIEEIVKNIYKDKQMKEGNEFSLLELYNTTYFEDLENTFYVYILPVCGRFEITVNESLEKYLQNKLGVIWGLCALLGVALMMLCIYIGIIFVKKLIHLLSVSRCILKIIPTIVINNTTELEGWIENKD